ncbi:HNH endonuclease [uncultured Pantoea sp.]|uniref:HNH endonuclease n=1 Tax=uncultured Pantoea sp. TaxID=218084 RepID=UPI00258F580A|nr:HNH endonuclease [uncultured Pantoea sp.]MDU4747377.1 HNH endonuclease [Pantoea sp.]
MIKQCSKCKHRKDITEFPTNGKNKATGQTLYRSACKICERKRDKARYVPAPSSPKPTHIRLTDTNRLAVEFSQWAKGQNPFDDTYSVDPVSGCWNWSGALCAAGYGCRLRKDSETTLAHRAMMEHLDYELSGMHVHHDCRNRKCINPDHLKVMTPDDHAALHAKELYSGHDIGPQLPKHSHRRAFTAKAAIVSYLESLPDSALAIPAARPYQYQPKTAKALRESEISVKTAVSGYLVSKLLKEIPLYKQLVNSTVILL